MNPRMANHLKIIAFIDDQQLVKYPAFNGIKNLGVQDVKRKPLPRANGRPTEASIIYDESSSPTADDYLIDVYYLIETYV